MQLTENHAPPEDKLDARLKEILGPGRVISDAQQRRLLSSDFYCEGVAARLAIRPKDSESLARAARTITESGLALIPRGGGMSYTGGYAPESRDSVIVDLGDLAGITQLDPANMVISVLAGTTWESIHQALTPLGLRLPFFGTLSGRRATVGGGLSNGAVFLGTARYGSAADNTLGLEVVCADGQVLKTGQAAFLNGRPFYRTFGPDLTGLFLHDCGALGIKTAATFRLIAAPKHQAYLSHVFPDALSAARALSSVGRTGAAEEAYVLDPNSTARHLEGSGLKKDLGVLAGIAGRQESWLAGLKAGARVIRAGKGFMPAAAFSLHLVCAGRTEAAVMSDRELCQELLQSEGGRQIPDSVPLAIRAAPFDQSDSVLGPQGERWVALNAKVPHDDAPRLIQAFDDLLADYRELMAEAGITVSTLYIAMGTHAFSFEPVFQWRDRWLPMHREIVGSGRHSRLREDAENPATSGLVAELRSRTMDLFCEFGAASNQIGRSYPYIERLEPGARDLLSAVKRHLDSDGLMNPGVLGFRTK